MDILTSDDTKTVMAFLEKWAARLARQQDTAYIPDGKERATVPPLEDAERKALITEMGPLMMLLFPLADNADSLTSGEWVEVAQKRFAAAQQQKEYDRRLLNYHWRLTNRKFDTLEQAYTDFDSIQEINPEKLRKEAEERTKELVERGIPNPVSDKTRSLVPKLVQKLTSDVHRGSIDLTTPYRSFLKSIGWDEDRFKREGIRFSAATEVE